MIEHFRRRKEVFVDQLGWDLPEYDGSDEERDRFDTPETVYRMLDGRLSFRLLPRDRSMVAALWPEVLHHVPDGAVEVSRFVQHGVSNVAELRRLMQEFRSEQGDLFAVADRNMLVFYKRALLLPPTVVVPIASEINLAIWRSRCSGVSSLKIA